MLATSTAQGLNNQIFGFLSNQGQDMADSKDNGQFAKLLDSMTGMNAKSGSVRAQVSVKTSVSFVDKANGNNVYAKTSVEAKASITSDKKSNEVVTTATEKVTKLSETEAADENLEIPENTEEVELLEATEVTEEDIEKIASIFVQIEIVIVETLNISMDDLNQSMEMLGMNLTDLVDESKLRDLFAFIKSDGNLMNLLNDNNLVKLCEDMMGEITNVLEKNGFDFETVLKTVETFKIAPTEENFELFTGIADEVKVISTSDGGKDFVVKKDYTEDDGDKPTKHVTIDFKEALKTSAKENSNQNSESDFSNSQDNNSELANTFLNNMMNVVAERIDFVESYSDVTNIREIANQILEQIKVNVTPDTKSLEIMLTPANLGKVNVTLSENNGVVTAKFTTETNVAREAIEANMQQFKENLEAKGITVSEIEVTVSDFSFNKNHGQNAEENQSQEKNKRHFSIDEINERLDGPTDSALQTLVDDGFSTVSFSA